MAIQDANTPEIAGFCKGFGLKGEECLAKRDGAKYL
jgi:hypothetical protein